MKQRIFSFLFVVVAASGFSLGSGCSADDATKPGGHAPGSGGSVGSGGSANTGGTDGSGGTVSGSGGNGDTGGGASTGGAGGETPDGGGGGSPPSGDGGGADLGAFQYFKNIQLDTTPTGANVTGDVPKYPVPIVLTAASFDFAQAKDKGADIRFSTTEGVSLPYAIELWDSTAKVAAIWVKVDVKGNQKGQIVLHWGNVAATDASDSHAVFDTKDGFVGVWHLSEPGSTTPSAYKDATANAADATGVAMQADSVGDGRVGKAASLSHAASQWIQVESAEKNTLFDIFDNITFSIWAQAKTHTVDYQCMFSKGEGSFRIHYFGTSFTTEICVEGILDQSGKTFDECPVNTKGQKVEAGKWFHLVGVTAHPKINYYINGIDESSDNDPSQWKSDATKAVMIGNNSSATKRSFDGLLDEARIMNVSKDINWVKLEYESQKEGQKFTSAGDTQKRF